jgi:hypothetical protein
MDKNIYHIDSNFLLNFLIPDDKDIYEIVKQKIYRNNWYKDIYRINIYALGEVFKKLLFAENEKNAKIVENNKNKILNLIRESHIEILSIDKINFERFIEHFKKLNEIDKRIEEGDKLNLSIFCADSDSKYFYTFDTGIIGSKKLLDYLRNLNKDIKEIK